MRARVVAVALLMVLGYGCATTSPPPAKGQEVLRGIASWYGEEFAGRTTANGEIFDPTLLTAAHRTFPFGTILEIVNTKTLQSVWVRVNDRGPYIANRVIDLSYAAAQKISLIEPGVGEVDIKVVKMGGGELEPPAAFDVTIAAAPSVAPAPTVVPATPQPKTEPPPLPVVVDRVVVETQRGDVITRKQVAADGKTVEEVPIGTARRVEPTRPRTSPSAKRQFVVQVGAFSVEANANALQEKLTSIGQRAWIDRDGLFRVRIGPFATRELAAETRASLEASGLSAIIVAE